MVQVECERPAAACRAEPHFIVGQDDHGWWMAIETHRLSGGLFKSRDAALHYVEFETGHRPGAFELASEPLRITF